MDWDTFEKTGAELARWGADYHRGVRDRPVRAQVDPGDILSVLPETPPETGTDIESILSDLDSKVMPGMTHWQHPRFFAYFPSNAAPPSILADFVTAILSPQCMLWQTSPAATEMEERMMGWLRQGVGLPDSFAGVIQDSASSATLAAVLVMRERALNWEGNSRGLSAHSPVRIYCSDQVHSSIDRAIWVAGIGQQNLVKIPTAGPMKAMDIAALEKAIAADRAAGFLPAGIIAATGGTGMGACDDVSAIVRVARAEGLYTHLDAAWAGSAMICPEFRGLWAGVEGVDSLVFNPHKWLGVQFDCAAHFIADPDLLRQTLAIRPEYLRTHGQTDVNDYSEWSVPLGRRFRALKLWFLIRSYGMEGLRRMIRDHVAWSRDLCEVLRETDGIEITTEPVLSLFTFRPTGADDEAVQALVDRINNDGRIYLTQTIVDGRKVIRFQAGQFNCTREDVMTVPRVLAELMV